MAVSIPWLIAQLDGSVEHVWAVVVHSEHEAAVDHDAQVMKAADRRVVVTADVLELALLAEIGAVDGLESDEQAPQS